MEQDVLVPWVLVKKGKRSKENGKKEQKEQDKGQDGDDQPPVKMRYYHLYKRGELTENAIKAGGKVVRDGYERDNWWVVVEKV
ncbi:unnamed protein product [Pichia kudriavzevii]